VVNFASIDFETATSSRDSACAVGVVIVENGEVTRAENRLIQPPGNRYESFNISIHGITPEETSTAPPFNEVWSEIADFIGSRIVIAHNAAFDISVLRHSAAHTDYSPPSIQFACSYRMSKDTWPGRWSYRLNDLAADLQVDLDHHNALSDANAAAAITMALLEHHSTASISEMAKALGYRVGESHPDGYLGFSNASAGGGTSLSAITAEGEDFDEEHPLFGRKVAFTGALNSMTRAEAAQKSVNVGASVTNSVGAKLDFLVVGQTDFARVGSDGMSSKLRKAVELAESGKPLEIIGEDDFLILVDL
jgi:DNA polymerase-3 subunit epsilon